MMLLFKYGVMFAVVTVSLPCFWFSSARCWIAPSIWRRLLMHAFFCEVVRAYLLNRNSGVTWKRGLLRTTDYVQ
jgi:hypothetical protein